MDYVDFGNTGLKVSVAGLGCGGHSRLGLSLGATTDQSVDVVRAAIDLGVTFLDTAADYHTEEIVGLAIKSQRDKIILSTKGAVDHRSKNGAADTLATPAELRASFHASLKKLNTDYIDIYSLHGVPLKRYDYCLSHLLPELLKLRDEGKIRCIGITEQFIVDPSHQMLTRALKDDIWQVIMVGFNMLNPSARNTVFNHTKPKGIATQIMFAVRRALSQPEALSTLLHSLVQDGHLAADAYNPDTPLGFLRDDSASLTNAAYRFCRHEPGVDLVLTGTSNIKHLRENIAAINDAPLSQKSTEHLRTLFGHINSVSGN
ncbi:MAG: aldo/keto reductase [Paracoccaceae bacterium]